jgi:hypothetical protein
VVIREGQFVELPSGRPFRPWGLNYDRDYRMRLIEDYWEAEWPTVVEDFAEMKALGANVVRVHLQVGQFMDAPDRMNAAALARLQKLLDLARDNGLRLDLTGLACYRRAAVPRWYADLDEAGRWTAQEAFWAGVAQACAGRESALFCYDLVNEPSVPDKPLTDWLAGELAGFTYCQVVTLDPHGRDRTKLACDWAARMTAAIRRHDPRTPITIGLLPFAEGTGFDVATLANQLDFIAVHYYPQQGKTDESAALIKRFAVAGKPLVVEEIFPMKCDAAELGRVMERCAPFVSGWVGFYWGQVAEEVERSTAPGDRMTAGWLRFFKDQKPLGH